MPIESLPIETIVIAGGSIATAVWLSKYNPAKFM